MAVAEGRCPKRPASADTYDTLFRMSRLALLALSVGLASSALFAQQVQQSREHSHLKIGDTAPDFTLPGTNNTTFKLSEYKGKKNVVLAFFPAAFTAG